MSSSEPDELSGSSALGKPAPFWVLCGVGGALSGALLFDAYLDWIVHGDVLWSTALEYSLPTLLALTLPYIGWRLLRNATAPIYLSEAARGTLFGSVAAIVLSSLLMGPHVLQEEIRAVAVIFQITAVGAIAGLWVGYTLARVKEAEREAQDDRDRLANLLNGLPDPVVHGKFKGDKLDVLSANTAFEQVFGHGVEAAVGKNLYDLVVPEEKREEAAEIDRLAIEQGLVEKEVRRLTTEGPRYFQLRAAKAKDDGASETYAIYTDITERKKREKELRLFKQAIEQANDAVLVTEAHPLDEPGPRIVYVNPAFEEMTGYSREEVQGKTPRILQGTETDREVLNSLREALENGKPWSGETINYRKGGEPFHLQWSIAPVKNEDGDIERWMSVQRDVTKDREREERLRQHTSLLEQTQRLAGAWEIDLRSGTVSASDKAYEIHEMDPEAEIDAEEILEFYPSEARQKVEETFERCAQEGKPYDLEIPFISAKGNRRWIRTVGGPAEKEDGKITKVAGAFEDITERKEEERRRRQVISRVTDAIVEVDSGWRFTLVNDQAEELYDMTEEDLLGENFWDVFAGALGTRFEEEYRGVMTSREPTRFEKHYPGLDGWFDIQVYPNEDGGIAFYFEEITERKKQEKELQRTTARLRALYENSPDMINVHDPEGSISDPNPRFMEKTGYDEQEVTGMKVWELDQQITREEALDLWNSMETGDRVKFEGALQRKNGSDFPVEIHLRKLDLEGKDRFMAISRDISESRKREKELRRAKMEAEEAETLFETIFENVPVMIEIADFESGYRRVNDHLEEVLGWTSEELREHPSTTELLYSTQEEMRRARELVETAPDGWHELQPLTKTGQTLDTLWTIAEAPDDSRLAIGLDITEQKQRERALKRAKKEAEEASRLKSAMLANMSHELRTPLTSITGFSEMLQENLDGELQLFATKIYKSSQRLQRTLESVLQLSTLEAGVDELEQEELSLGAVVEGVVEILDRDAKEKSVAVTTKIPNSPVLGCWNEDAAHRICRNLLENAIKFTPEGGRIDVRVSLNKQDAILEIEDTGIGMDPEKVPDLFNPFKQESEGLDREYEGTGLGLSIAERLVKELNGTIDVETEKGVGTCFTVRLPPNHPSGGDHRGRQ